METLTERQEAVLDFVSSYLHKHKAPPAMREIQEHFGFRSTNSVSEHLAALEEKGYLKRRSGVSRGLELLGKEISLHPLVESVPLVGEIAAGTPVLAEQNIEGYVHLDKTFLRGDGHFLLKVKGDSMERAGIYNGDFVLVKRQGDADPGQIVAAYLAGEATVKYFKVRRGCAFLEPAHPAYRPIRVTKKKYPDFRILGQVRGVLRIL